MRKKHIILIALAMGILVGCSNKEAESGEISGNRAIVLNFVNNNKEDSSTRELYQRLASEIIEFNGKDETITVENAGIANDTGTSNITDDYNSKESKVETTEVDDTQVENVEIAWNIGTGNITDEYNSYDSVLAPGIYISGYDIPSGKFRIATETPNHGINCLVLETHQRIQPGNFDNSIDGLYRYTLEIPDNTIVQLGTNTYFEKLDSEFEIDTDNDMSDRYFYNPSATELYLLAYIGKKPTVEIEGTIIKKYSDGYAIMYDDSVTKVEIADREYAEGDKLLAEGVLEGTFESGTVKSGIIKVTEEDI